MEGKIPMRAVQAAFSEAIRRRDRLCRVRNFEPCSGRLECSHFHTQGSSPSLMFYPWNAHAQCAKHHRDHHDGKERFYSEWMEREHPYEVEWMERSRSSRIKYDDELKRKVIVLCNEDRLLELADLIRSLLGGW